jgi:hypothetical protein
MLMTLVPAKALRDDYLGSFDSAIEEHLLGLSISLKSDEIGALRDLIINIRKLKGITSEQARSKSAGLATVKASHHYKRLRTNQGNRCCWCGVELDRSDIFETLEHLVPKHLGDDPSDGSNWALACDTCNSGKGDAWAWSATPWAHDYVQRNQFIDPDVLEASHRWVVLRRTPICDGCGAKPSSAELFIYRRISTGLAIPANCSSSCRRCADSKNLEVLVVRWSSREIGRGKVGSTVGSQSATR